MADFEYIPPPPRGIAAVCLVPLLVIGIGIYTSNYSLSLVSVLWLIDRFSTDELRKWAATQSHD